ncbi:DedA family protein [Thermicanus aegyptius]|uniref:DedA family protein n=1 Tax=Thermicanus aegyptius TaxID=94009 RepID=UPI0004007AA8|nr:DedA family protein [Thermicanus aegyptius]
MSFLSIDLQHDGYIVLFFALMLELLALPLPGELLMSYAGVLVFEGKLNWILSILLAWLGTTVGITLSYFIGYKLGRPFFEKHGWRIHMGPERLEKTSEWFRRYGIPFLMIAYFIPGIRHMTGYFSGITRIPFHRYMAYAYTGAFLWVNTFIALGKMFGPKWEQYHHTIKKYFLFFGILIAAIFAVAYFFKKLRSQILKSP